MYVQAGKVLPVFRRFEIFDLTPIRQTRALYTSFLLLHLRLLSSHSVLLSQQVIQACPLLLWGNEMINMKE